MDKTHCFYIITTVKPNIRVNRRGAVLPQARGRFTPSMEQNGFIGAHFKFVITYVLVIQSFRDMYYTQSIYIYLNNITAQLCIDKLWIQKYTTCPLGGGRATPGYPTVCNTLYTGGPRGPVHEGLAPSTRHS